LSPSKHFKLLSNKGGLGKTREKREKKGVLPRPLRHVTRMPRDVRHFTNHVTARSRDYKSRDRAVSRDGADNSAVRSKLEVFVVRPTVKESIKSFVASWLRLAVGDSLIALFVDGQDV